MLVTASTLRGAREAFRGDARRAVATVKAQDGRLLVELLHNVVEGVAHRVERYAGSSGVCTFRTLRAELNRRCAASGVSFSLYMSQAAATAALPEQQKAQLRHVCVLHAACCVRRAACGVRRAGHLRPCPPLQWIRTRLPAEAGHSPVGCGSPLAVIVAAGLPSDVGR